MKWVGVGVAVATIVVAVWWFTRSEPKPPRPVATRSATIKLDVAAFKRLRDARAERAKRLAQERPRRPGSGSGLANVPMTREFAGRQCGIGTAELCDLLADLFADCDAGDGSACLALGQFVADNPPRATIAIVFFGKACDLGNAEACAYRKRIDEPLSRCADDPFLCGWKAMKTNDLAMYEEACDLGAGDACSSVSFFGGDKQGDLVKSQLYLEKACQLGLPMACQGLADRLSESCESLEGDVVRSCFPVDEALAASARAIACEAGWGDGCTYN